MPLSFTQFWKVHKRSMDDIYRSIFGCIEIQFTVHNKSEWQDSAMESAKKMCALNNVFNFVVRRTVEKDFWSTEESVTSTF